MTAQAMRGRSTLELHAAQSVALIDLRIPVLSLRFVIGITSVGAGLALMGASQAWDGF